MNGQKKKRNGKKKKKYSKVTISESISRIARRAKQIEVQFTGFFFQTFFQVYECNFLDLFFLEIVVEHKNGDYFYINSKTKC
jgi:hypothetical protein